MPLTPIGTLVFHFSDMEDPRGDNRRHLLLDLIGGKQLRRSHDNAEGKKAGWDNDYLLKVLTG